MKVSSESPAGPPYMRIAAELRRRIEEGRLGPGDPLPSTRQIVRDFDVAMATATKALAVLQRDGLARPVPGVGTVVESVSAPARPPRDHPRAGSPLSRGRIIATALRIADNEGLTALSMRRVASELSVTSMALYRHVSNREHLILLMADAVYGDFPVPEPPPAGWRRQLETAARLQWAMYHHHPWLALVTSFTRPLLAPRVLAHTEWMMSVLDGAGLGPVAALHALVAVAAHVRGLAVDLESEADVQARSGMTDEQWMRARATPAMTGPASEPRFLHLALIPPRALDLDTAFEFGLQHLLDGIAALIGNRTTPIASDKWP